MVSNTRLHKIVTIFRISLQNSEFLTLKQQRVAIFFYNSPAFLTQNKRYMFENKLIKRCCQLCFYTLKIYGDPVIAIRLKKQIEIESSCFLVRPGRHEP